MHTRAYRRLSTIKFQPLSSAHPEAMKTTATIKIPYGDELVELDLGVPAPVSEQWNTGIDCIDHILNGGLFNPLLKDPALPEIRGRWRAQLRAAILTPPDTAELLKDFHTQWHVCHHFLRELVDDDDLLFDYTRAWLPKYEGLDLVLYRGENIDRFQAGKLGSAWTDKKETADMFASGLNAVGQGGMILQATVPASLIIAGPSAHSLRMGESEFTVDPRTLTDVVTVATFPPNHLLQR